MRTLIALLATTALCGPVHAYTITASGVFDVTYHGVDPAYEGSGFFDIHENRIADFEFSLLGFTWTDADLNSRRCNAAELSPSDPVCRAFDLTGLGDFILDIIALPFSSDAGGGVLVWDFLHSNFSIRFDAGGIAFAGTSENGEASGGFRDFTHRINVSEPNSLLLLIGGVAALMLVRSRIAKPAALLRCPNICLPRLKWPRA